MKTEKLRRIINCKVEIYDTKYTAVYHKDGSISVNAPYVKWNNNNGVLAFKKIKLTDESEIKIVKKMFAEDMLVTDNGITMDDILFGIN